MKQYRPDTTYPRGYTPGNGEPRVLPIVQSTTYTYDSSKEMGDLFDLKADGFFYTRLATRRSTLWKRSLRHSRAA